MTDDGDTKDDVKVPDGEVGDKINKLFKVDEKDTSKSQGHIPQRPRTSVSYLFSNTDSHLHRCCYSHFHG